jgi:hypothetical protein
MSQGGPFSEPARDGTRSRTSRGSTSWREPRCPAASRARLRRADAPARRGPFAGPARSMRASPWEEESASACSPAHRSQCPGEASSPGEQRPRARVTPCPRVSDSGEVPGPGAGPRQRELSRLTAGGLRASRDATASSGGRSSEGRNPMSATGTKQGRRARQGASRREGAKPWGRRRSRVRQARCRWTCPASSAGGDRNLEGGSAQLQLPAR